jgi:hypothetical protein
MQRTDAFCSGRDEAVVDPSGSESKPTAAAQRSIGVHRVGNRAVMLDVQLAGYHEVFFIVTGDRSVVITMMDEGDRTHPEAQVFVFAKPYGWDLDCPADELLLRVWAAVGVQR